MYAIARFSSSTPLNGADAVMPIAMAVAKRPNVQFKFRQRNLPRRTYVCHRNFPNRQRQLSRT
jgi:hypothetical protein